MAITADALTLPQRRPETVELFHHHGEQRGWGTAKAIMVQKLPTVRKLTAAIARSPIIAARPVMRLPDHFESVDAAILEWIAAEARSIRR